MYVMEIIFQPLGALQAWIQDGEDSVGKQMIIPKKEKEKKVPSYFFIKFYRTIMEKEKKKFFKILNQKDEESKS